MTLQKVEIETRGRVGIIRMNDPTTLNALSLQMVDELEEALDMLVTSTRAIILTGAGRAFCSGANLSSGMSAQGPDAQPDFGLPLETHINPLMTRLRNLPIPWISAVRGAAAGAGCSLALAGDLVVSGESAYFLEAFVRIGLVPDAGSTHLLVRSVGRVRAMEMMLLGDRVGAMHALDWGLVNRVVPDDKLDDTAFELADRLANGPTRTLGQIRNLVWAAIDEDWTATLEAERTMQRTAGLSSDAGEGIKAFLEKRAASFSGD